MKRRLLSLALALCLCVGLAVPAWAFDMGRAGEYNIISVGGDYTAAIDENGTLWMWGYNGVGQLGNGCKGNAENSYHMVMQTVPVKVLDNVASVSCGEYHTAAIKTDGTLWMWGKNGSGQLGNGGEGNANIKHYGSVQTVPVKIMDNVAAVSCGESHTAAIKTDGTLWMWGNNTDGQLGNGGVGNRIGSGYSHQTVPVKIMDGVASVSCGSTYTAAIKTDGALYMWGRNVTGGMLGSAPGEGAATDPVKVLDNVASVSCGGAHSAAIKTDGTLWMWGNNTDGQLGNGSTENSAVPVKVLDNVAAVSCAATWMHGHTAAIKTDGSLWTWGSNRYYTLGNGGGGNREERRSDYSYQTVPVKIMDGVAAVNCTPDHDIAVKEDGTLWTWGGNSFGVLGCGKMDGYSKVPIQITLGEGISMPKGVRLYLNGGVGGGSLWTDATGTIKVPTNPTKEGYTFGGWYTDAALTVPWNFNDKVVNTLVLYAKWMPISSTAATTNQSTQVITLNGNTVTLDAYVLKADSNGGDMTFVKLRDIAALLDSTGAKFNVDWRRGAIYVDTGKAYTTKNGTELKRISGTDGSYKWNTAPVLFDGTTKALEGIVLTDGKGGGHTFFKLRDLGKAVGFTVGWSAQQGIYIETD